MFCLAVQDRNTSTVWDWNVGCDSPLSYQLPHLYPPMTFVSWKIPRSIFACTIPRKADSMPQFRSLRMLYDLNIIVHTPFLPLPPFPPCKSLLTPTHVKPICFSPLRRSGCPPSRVPWLHSRIHISLPLICSPHIWVLCSIYVPRKVEDRIVCCGCYSQEQRNHTHLYHPLI